MRIIHQRYVLPSVLSACLVLLSLCSCTTTTDFDTNVRVHYTTEKELKDTEIEVPEYSKECYNAIKLGVNVSIDDQTGFSKTYVMDFSDSKKSVLDKQAFSEAARSFALNYLARLKRYSVYVGDLETPEAVFQMVTEQGTLQVSAYKKADLDYCLNLNIHLIKEIHEGYNFDREIYKVQLDYHLFDVKTGREFTPGTAKNLTTRKSSVYAYGGAKIGGSKVENVRNAYMNVLENCMIEMRCQLANNLPIAGNVEKGVNRDGQFTLILDKGINQGVTGHQQFVVFANVDDFPIPLAYATARGTQDPNTSALVIWRKSSSKEAKAIFKEWKNNIQGWIDDNEIYAVSKGMPPLPPAERTNVQDWSTTKFERQLLEEWK